MALDASNAVRLVTVHGAKGLEFPIVFVPEAHLASRADNDSVRWRSVDGISRTLAREVGAAGSRRRPGFYTYLLDRDAAEEVAEHKRLFYVAATRAADALYINGNETSGGAGWLAAALEVVGTASRDGVEVRQPLIVGGGGGARRPAPRSWNEGVSLSHLGASGRFLACPRLGCRDRAAPGGGLRPCASLGERQPHT